jgi:hypothetical protein
MKCTPTVLLPFALLTFSTFACAGGNPSTDDGPPEDATDDGKADRPGSSGTGADGSADESADDGGGGVGLLPCDGCAGDPCEVHEDCLDGFLCTRVDASTAFCTNCTASAFDPVVPDECISECTADIHCWEGGVCQDGVCLHGCASEADCPSGHTCRSSGACVPAGLPGLGEECVAEEAYLCALDGPTAYACIGQFEDGEAIEAWCSKPCDEDVECTDVWVSGCCGTIQDGSTWCVPYAYSGSCGGGTSEPICENTCLWAGDGECDDGGPGADWDLCEYGTDCQDCGPRE